MSSTSNSGPITFFASDIEGSTRLWEGQPAAMSAALHRHDGLLREAIAACGGQIFKTVGDGVFAIFPVGGAAAQAALSVQRLLAEETWPTDRPIRVRIALHTGAAEERDGDYFGPTLNRLARLLSIGHGGQVLLSETAAVFSREGLPEGAALRDLGRHRLKDLDQAEAVAMLVHPSLDGQFPALRSLDALPNNLPRQMTSFVGRERERRAVATLLGTSALVTLTGAGGTGKTRLAIQTAAEILEEFPDGVWLVELAAITDPTLVPQAIATALGVREEASPTQALLAALQGRTTLIVLDNCEHLLDACADLVQRALQTAPGLKVIVTSREALNLPGEATYRVPTLSVAQGVKTVTEALAHDAIRLLVDRVRLVDSRFEFTDRMAPVAAGICARLDGIPLAIELAASRAKALSLEAIAARLDDRFRLLTAGSRTALPRQQTLKATIDWSHDLLDPPDRVLLRRVSVFAGGWALEAAETVCGGDELESWEVLDGLMRLVEKSLVVYDAEGDERYRLLESVRQYAAERLGPDEAVATRERHADFYAALVISSEDGIQGPDQARWLAILEREHDNIRAALGFFRDRPDHCESALGLVGAIGRFWTVRGYLTEGRAWIESLLDCAPPEPTLSKATAWRTAGQIAYWQGDSEAGRRFGEASLAICRELGDQDGEIKSLFRLGFAYLADSELATARKQFEEALALGRQTDSPGIPHLLNAVGEVEFAEGRLDDARGHFELALAGFRQGEDQRSIASVLKNLASVAVERQDYPTAFRSLAEGIEIRNALGSLPGVAATLQSFAVLAGAQGRNERAVVLLATADALHRTYGSQSEPVETARIEAVRVAALEALGRHAFDALWRQGTSMDVERTIELAVRDEEPDTPA